MKAAYIRQTGDPDVIQVGQMPDPQPAAGEVLIRVQAVSVNPIDTYVRSGAVAFDLPDPFIIGCDAAGSVEAVGENVSGFAVVTEFGVRIKACLDGRAPLRKRLLWDRNGVFTCPKKSASKMRRLAHWSR